MYMISEFVFPNFNSEFLFLTFTNGQWITEANEVQND